MSYLDVTHIAIGVPAPLREAEAVYARLFDLDVAWREPVPDGAPFDLGWDDLDAAGSRPTIVLMHRDAFRLAITEEHGSVGTGGIQHVGVQVTGDRLRTVRARAIEAGCAVVAEREDELFDFVDPFGIEWELDTRSHADPRAIVEQKRRRESP